jgi:RNA polymerase sigma factor (sigma-70 family)
VELEFTEENIAKYAKKIMGFAWSKTKNPTQAEDLSQEIMLALTKALRRQKIVTDLDGFVFKISQYTWSNYLRANKKHWNNLDLDKLEEIQDNREEAKEDDERLNLMQRLREQLAYLNNLYTPCSL